LFLFHGNRLRNALQSSVCFCRVHIYVCHVSFFLAWHAAAKVNIETVSSCSLYRSLVLGGALCLPCKQRKARVVGSHTTAATA
jgi:hypothetical protein